MRNFYKDLKKNASLKLGKIVLPEANVDERVLTACKIILSKNLGDIVVLGEAVDYPRSFRNNPHCTIVNNLDTKTIDEYACQFQEMRKARGKDITLSEAKKLMRNKMYFSMMLVHNGLADGVLAGAVETTANVLKPALQIIRTKKNKNIVTGSMLMIKDKQPIRLFGDVSLIENPTSENLAEIAISNAEFMKKVVLEEPKVAMLSYSTKGSASSEMTEKVRLATTLAKKSSKYAIDGEMQADSALDAVTAKRKGLTSRVAGQANVFVFPDLNAGNIAYKLVERLGNFKTIGPIMLNFNKPVNDLSRGCTVQEIVDTYCITKLMQN